MMKRRWLIAVAAFLLPMVVAVPPWAADATVAVDLNSAYVWRGITFNDSVVMQPSLDVQKGAFGLNVWGNLDLDDYGEAIDSGEFSEVDITLSYDIVLDPAIISIGYIEYLFPGVAGAEGTREVFVGAALDFTYGFSGGLDIYYDFDEVDTYYINAGVAYSTALSEGVGLELGASAGYYGGNATADGDAGFFDYLLSVGIGYAFADDLNVSASLHYTDAIDSDKLPDGNGAQDVNVYGGIGIAYFF
ncbi:MAG: hypothetical protein R6U50_17620 [Desulfobacterales bacterium]